MGRERLISETMVYFSSNSKGARCKQKISKAKREFQFTDHIVREVGSGIKGGVVIIIVVVLERKEKADKHSGLLAASTN